MNETTRLLEQMADRSDEARLAPPAALRERGTRLTRRRRARWGTGVALVAAAAAIWAVGSRPPTRPEPVKPPRSVDLPHRVTEPKGPATWSVQLPGQGDFWVRALAYHDGT